MTSPKLLVDEAGPNGADKQFTGYERDNESDLDYAKARYYKPSHGRFTTVDPVLITPYRLVNPQALNPYSYVANTPLKFTDPTGKTIRFRNEEDAKKAVDLYKRGLSKDQQSAVSYEKDKKGNFVLKVDAKAAQKAGADSLLGRLNVVATHQKVAVVDFVKNNTGFEVIRFGVESSKENTSFAKEVAATEGRVKELAGLTLPEFGGKDNPKYNYGPANSAEKGVTRILISSEAKSFTLSQAIYAESLAHFQTLIESGDARKAVHPTVNDDEESIVEEVRKNEQSNNAPKKKP